MLPSFLFEIKLLFIRLGEIVHITRSFQTFSFRDPVNERINRLLITNAKALDGMDKVSTETITRKQFNVDSINTFM